MEIKLSKEESEEYFYNALCNDLSHYCNSNGLFVDTFGKYQKVKKELSTETNTPCYEDVLMQILRTGGRIHIVDEEGDGDQNVAVTLAMVHERVQLTPVEHLLNMITENDDATTAWVILNQVFYNEQIFG